MRVTKFCDLKQNKGLSGHIGISPKSFDAALTLRHSAVHVTPDMRTAVLSSRSSAESPGPSSETKMKTQQRILMILVVVLSLSFAHMSLAQQQSSVVPTLVNFSGTLTDANNKPVASTAGVTFYLYNAQEGGSPLWMETQNVQPDKNGHYTVTLGSTTSQ